MSTVSARTEPAYAGRHASLSMLRDRLHGKLIVPGDLAYAETRKIFNGMIDRHPAAIACCADTDDVVASINAAREAGMPISVRGGGHGIAGESIADDGLMIDLTPMKRVVVDEESRIARAQPGLRLGELIQATERYGLVTPTGTASDTGVAGLTLGGGFGYLSAKHGLAVDNVVGAEVVLADGSVVHASEADHPDLFWAIRGGSGNFGIVTEFEYKLYPLAQVLGGRVMHSLARAREVMEYYREISTTLPDELMVSVGMLTDRDGNKLIGMVACWSGEDIEEGERVLAPIRAFGPPVADTIHSMPYSAMNSLLDDALPHGLRFYWKQSFVQALEDELIDIIIDFAEKAPSPRSIVLIDETHGAATRVSPSATAFAHREARYGLVMLGAWDDPADDEINIAWTRELAIAARPYSTGGVYLNKAVGEKPRAIYGSNYDRLAEIKARYDPMNLFRHNANIQPAASAAPDAAG